MRLLRLQQVVLLVQMLLWPVKSLTTRRRYRRRPRVYLRGLHLGCLGCSIPLLAALGVLVAALAVLFL